MGGCFSLTLDDAVNNVFSFLCGHINYVHNLEDNLAALETTTQQLKAKRDDLLTRIQAEEDRGRQRLEEVQVWLSRVQTIEKQVDDLLRDRAAEIQRLCLFGFCSENFVSSHSYGEKVFKTLQKVEDLTSTGVFQVMTTEAPPPKVEMRPIQPTVGQEDTLETTWRCLMEDGVGILGLYGMGGVGKTTLLTQINNKFDTKQGNFDIIIWVVVSKDMQIQRIQEEIGEKLGFNSEEWNQKKETRKKASDIHNVLIRKRFVLLLDDLWEKVDLTEIGVPFPDIQNKCKVVFTTRSKQVCGKMRAHATMEVECLGWNDAWDLFKKTVGEITLGSHPDIPELAETIATKCRGLPLALKVIGETMASKTMVQEWRLAVDDLTWSAAEFSGMEEEILPILKYSYDNLQDEKIKMCFQYCALFPEDYKIRKEELVDYLIGEGIIDGNKDIERQENEGYEMIGTLLRACLVMEVNKEDVKMHDVVREMALWVASDLGNQKENFIVQAGAKLHQIPKVKNWGVVKRMSLMDNQIEEISGSPQCLKLETLFLQYNDLVNISGEFFQSMPRLRVLDLSWNQDLAELREEISELVFLQYLNLSGTKIKQLPVGLQKLKKLMHLNLEKTGRLESILGISYLSSLRVLRLSGSSVIVDVKELQLLEHLKSLTMDMRFAFAPEQLLSNEKLASCTRHLCLRKVELESSGISFVANMDSLCRLEIINSVVPEIKIDRRGNRRETSLPLHESLGPCFPNLRHVHVDRCKGMRDLTWLLFAPNLVGLRVYNCGQVEEIISKEKATGIIPFQRLERLGLDHLPELKSIYWSPLPFPRLSNLEVKSCPKLRKLPFDSKSVPAVDDERFKTYVKTKEWLEGVEWEDEATKHRFLRIFTLSGALRKLYGAF